MPDQAAGWQDVLDRITIPQEQRYVAVSRDEGKFLYEWVRDHGLSRTLEIGLAYGASAACILAAHSGTHTCIDPHQQRNYQNAGLHNLETLGYQDRVILHQDFSHTILPKLHAEGQKFDFVFVDGDHRFDSIFIDFYYADLLLAQGGYILFHDAWMRPTQLIASYIQRNRRNYQRIRRVGLNLILFQKSGIARTTWHQFSEFYTLRGLVSHIVIRAMIRLFAR